MLAKGTTLAGPSLKLPRSMTGARAVPETYPQLFPFTTVYLTETLNLLQSPQVVVLTTVAKLGFTPAVVTLGGAPQVFQIGADGSVLVLAGLSPYETKTYTILP